MARMEDTSFAYLMLLGRTCFRIVKLQHDWGKDKFKMQKGKKSIEVFI